MNPKLPKDQPPAGEKTSEIGEVRGSAEGRSFYRWPDCVPRLTAMCTKIASVVLLALLFWATLSSSLSAQDSGPGGRDDAEWNLPIGLNPLLSPNEGLDILGAALDTRHRLTNERDCSHLVHAVYERAGFPYPYSNSRELYAGIEQFQSITQPQPGDLIVWRGHVGIIVSPAKRSFFSALRSGRGVEKYDSPYWRRRGLPRFFRYVRYSPSLSDSATPTNSAWLRSFAFRPYPKIDVPLEHPPDSAQGPTRAH
jgi:NlpC/P60 family